MMIKKWLKQTKNEKGLTLVELLAVVVILGIIAAIAVPSIGGIIENSKKDAAISNAQQVLSAARLYAASGGDTSNEVVYDEGNGAIAEYHEDITNPWDNETISYTVSFEGTVPAISMTYPDKCTIGSTTPLEAAELATAGRSACEGN
ncbi:type II secretion system protein [Alkalihalophilus pseudofirmus]|uniref:type II secretion system protein n=1 Tax=Alkalihalophilus pseudofirmus TaxID=79885 RepID=UPI0026C6B044